MAAVPAAARSSAVGLGWLGVAARAACAALLMHGAAGAAITASAAAGSVWVSPVWPGYWPAQPLFYPNLRGACPYFGACAGPGWDERRLRPRPSAPGEPPPPETDIWGSTGSPWGYVRRLPPPTPESQIQPRFRDASTVRPEFGGPQPEADAPADAPAAGRRSP